jgi:hypothetical protein
MAKKKIMSLSIEPDKQQILKLVADKKTDGNVSQLVSDLVDKYLVIDEDVTPVIIKVPNALKSDREEMKKWLDTKVLAILKALT